MHQVIWKELWADPACAKEEKPVLRRGNWISSAQELLCSRWGLLTGTCASLSFLCSGLGMLPVLHTSEHTHVGVAEHKTDVPLPSKIKNHARFREWIFYFDWISLCLPNRKLQQNYARAGRGFSGFFWRRIRLDCQKWRQPKSLVTLGSLNLLFQRIRLRE